jgi:hypothetical protein
MFGAPNALGSVFDVIGELFAVGRRLSWERTLWGLAVGFALAFATDVVLKIAGA